MLTIKSRLDVLIVGVDVVQDGVCVHLVGGGEDDHLEVLVCFFEAFHDVRTDVDASVHCFFVGEVDFEDDVRVLRFDVVNAMDQSLVHVEDD